MSTLPLSWVRFDRSILRSVLLPLLFSLLLLSSFAPERALAAPPGIYSLGGEFRDRDPFPPLRRDQIEGLRNHGASVLLNGRQHSGVSRIVRPGAEPILLSEIPLAQEPGIINTAIFEVSEDTQSFLIQRRYPSGSDPRRDYALQSTSGNARPIDIQEGLNIVFSPNGEYVADSRLTALNPSTRAFENEVYRLTVTGGVEPFVRPAGYDVVRPSAIANNGIITGHGMVPITDSFGTIVLDYRPNGVVQWDLDGTPTAIIGTDDAGQPWTLSTLTDVRDDGGLLLGYGRFETPEHVSPGFIGVVDPTTGLDWIAEDLSDAGFFSYTPNAMTDDGRIIVGGVEDHRNSEKEALIWTRDGGRQSFATYLNLAGIDTTGWTFEEVIDVSADGQSFAGYATRDGSTDYLFYAVIPEPSTALLLGFGLAVLSGRKRPERD